MTSVLLDIETLATELLSETLWFANYHKQTINYTFDPVHIKKTMKHVRALIDDLVTDRLNWASNEPTSHYEGFKELAPWFDYDAQDTMGNLYFNEVYDPFYCRVDELLCQTIPSNTWFQWTITEVGSTLVLHKGRDYRIIEWERITGYVSPRIQKTAAIIKKGSTKPKRKMISRI